MSISKIKKLSYIYLTIQSTTDRKRVQYIMDKLTILLNIYLFLKTVIARKNPIIASPP